MFLEVHDMFLALLLLAISILVRGIFSFFNPNAPPESFSELLDYIISHGMTLIGEFNARVELNGYESRNAAGRTIP